MSESNLAVLPAVTTVEERQVNGAVLGVQSARQALGAIAQSAARVNAPAQELLAKGTLQRDLAQPNDRLQTAVNGEIAADVGTHASDAQVGQTGQRITARFGGDPAAQKLAGAAVPRVQTDREVDTIIRAAQSGSDPVKALDALNAGYANAPANVKQAVLASPGARKVIDAAARWADEPLTQRPQAGMLPQGQTLEAIERLAYATRGLNKTLAGTVADCVAPGFQSFAGNPHNNDTPVMDMQGVTTLIDLSAHITGTSQGDDAVTRFAATGAWNSDAVRQAIGSGTDPAYAIAVWQQIKASGQSPSIVVQPIIDGVQQFKDKVDGDVQKLAQHDSALAWLVQNDGAGMTPQQLNQAVAAYRTAKGPAWEKAETALRQQVAQDGSTLARQMIALNQSALQLSGASGQVDQAA